MFGLSQIAIEVIAAAVMALLIFGGGMKLQYDIDASNLTKTELAYQTSQTQAVAAAAAKQKATDDAALQAAADEAKAQAAQAATVQQELSDVQSFVTVKTVPCVPYGLLRLLNAAVLGVSPDSIALPAGKSNDACSPVTVDELASTVVSNYGTANANAEQLNALIALLKKNGVKETK